IDLAGAHKNAPVWRASFALARRLRTLADDHPEQFEAAVLAFCEKTGHDFEEMWYDFLACWEKVKIAEGIDILGWALARAKAEPYQAIPSFGAKYALLASTAWHLAQHTHPAPFWLPCKRLGALLGCTPMTVSRVIDLLEKNNIIKCVNETYSFANNQ